MGLGGAEGVEVSGLASWVKSDPLWRQGALAGEGAGTGFCSGYLCLEFPSGDVQ